MLLLHDSEANQGFGEARCRLQVVLQAAFNIEGGVESAGSGLTGRNVSLAAFYALRLPSVVETAELIISLKLLGSGLAFVCNGRISQKGPGRLLYVGNNCVHVVAYQSPIHAILVSAWALGSESS